MTRFKLTIFVLLYIVLVSCGNQQVKSSSEEQNVIGDTVIGITVQKEPDNKSSIDYTAIGNIHMDIDDLQFEQEKESFLKDHHELGGLAIKCINGFFYNNRLAAIEIISEQQEIHRRIMNGITNNEGWLPLYVSKYGISNVRKTSKYLSYGRLSLFEKNNFIIEVSDLCNSPKRHDSFEDIVICPPKQCYGHDFNSLKFDRSNNISRILSVNSLIDELPKDRADFLKQQYNNDRNRIVSDNPMERISLESAIDQKYFNLILPEVQAHRDRLMNIHRNDPSWSIIIIYYKPLLEKYYHDTEMKKEQKNQERKSELEII